MRLLFPIYHARLGGSSAYFSSSALPCLGRTDGSVTSVVADPRCPRQYREIEFSTTLPTRVIFLRGWPSVTRASKCPTRSPRLCFAEARFYSSAFGGLEQRCPWPQLV